MSEAQELSRQLAATVKARAVYHGARRVGEARKACISEWEQLQSEAICCIKCGLCETRSSVVFGEGSLDAELMFVGEAPGRDEDLQGRPFVGRAGKLLTDMIVAMGLRREEVYIANVLKCRPPDNRDPQPDEVAACRPYLERQIAHIQPKVLCALGRHALRSLSDVSGGITKLRGKPLRAFDRILMPTYHPAYLLRNPAAKREVWEDLKAILKILGRPVPKRR